MVSFVCASVVAILYTFSLGTMLPFLKVLVGEESVHEWVYRGIVSDRAWISIAPQRIRGQDDLPDDETVRTLSFRVMDVEKDSPAAKAGLQPEDVIHGFQGLSPFNDRAIALAYLSKCPPFQPRVVTGLREPGKALTLEVELEQPPFWAGAAYYVLNFLPTEQDENFLKKSILTIAILLLIATVVRCLFRFFQEYLVRRVAQRCVMLLRLEAFGNALRLPVNYYSREGSTDPMSRFLQDTNKISNVINMLFGKSVREPLKLVLMLGSAFYLSPKVTSYMLLVAPLVVIVIGVLGRQLKKATKRELQSWADIMGRIRESLQSIRVVKAYHREAYEHDRFKAQASRLLQRQYRMAKLDSASGPLLETLGTLAGCTCMVGAASWLSAGDLEPSTFITLVAFLGAAAEAGRKMGNVVARLNIANAGAERVYQLVDTPGERDLPQVADLPRMTKSIRFEKIAFTYPQSPQPTLLDVDLSVSAGQRIAIVGPNGSGKTTLVGLIPRFFTPHSGRILIDGQDIAMVTLASLRQQIGMVTQQTVVFNDSIASNIVYGNLEATPAEMVAAAKKAYAHEFVMQTDAGYETVIGEQGATLSGGQLQRLAIARAILRDPAILIFDEATSQIDSDSETKIQRALAEFTQDRTSFIIAHRLSTIVDADKIVVMDQGRIIAEGQHQQLLASCPLYRQLYETQFNEAS